MSGIEERTKDNRKCYTIAKVSLDDMVVGAYTNRKKLYAKIKELCKDSTMTAFSGVIEYEQKKLNYTNLLTLLNILLVDEKFFINVVDKNNIIHIYEIKKLEQNK